MLRIIVLASAASLLGCSGNYDQMDAWMGLSKQSVLDSFLTDNRTPPDGIARGLDTVATTR